MNRAKELRILNYNNHNSSSSSSSNNNNSSSLMHEEAATTSLRPSSHNGQRQEKAASSHQQRPVKRYSSVGGARSSAAQANYGVQVGSVGPVFSLIGREDRSGPLRPRPQPHREHQSSQFRSKSVSWKDPMMYLQRLGSSRAPLFNQNKGANIGRQHPKVFSQRKESSPDRKKPSAWSRLLKKLGFDGGKKVHAARSEWLNYDAQSYAMNFEKDRETQYSSSSHHMPKISGPGAREIVTVLLQRSSSHNRNSGSILIPKPVPHNVAKAELTTPLWKRRSVNAPSSLDLHKFRASTTSKRRGTSM